LQEALNDVVTTAEFLVAWSGADARKADPALWKEMEGNIKISGRSNRDVLSLHGRGLSGFFQFLTDDRI
jgi:hypothetical protein